MAETRVVTFAAITRCPITNLQPSHYHDDGSCRCVTEGEGQ